MQGLKEVASETGAFVEYSASLLPELTNPPATQKLCIHPWEYCYINARGRIGFCDHLNGREEFAWGEWGKQAFLEYWNGDRMKRLRAEHLSRLAGSRLLHVRTAIGAMTAATWISKIGSLRSGLPTGSGLE